MSLSVDLISQFAKATKSDKKEKSESTAYGTTVKYEDRMYVRLDGSELLTPVTTTTNMHPFSSREGNSSLPGNGKNPIYI